jgi:DedD protein
MAGRTRKRSSDRVLESRHLVGLFLGVVLLCGVFFTLGYVMGRTQYGGSVQAADPAENNIRRPSPAAKLKQNDTPPAPAAGEWNIYANKNDDHLEPAPAPKAPSATPPAVSPTPASDTPAAVAPVPWVTEKPTGAVTRPARLGPPKIVKGAIELQVAAVVRQSDALAMADVLQQKKFPSFVVAPASDNFYRVQVGPYTDLRAAEAAKSALERAGFRPILRR